MRKTEFMQQGAAVLFPRVMDRMPAVGAFQPVASQADRAAKITVECLESMSVALEGAGYEFDPESAPQGFRE